MADIAATCVPLAPERQALEEPFLIVEILSPSTERHDRRIKLPVYRQIDTVQEILLIDSDGIYAELHRRAGTQWITEILRGPEAMLSLTSAGMEVRLGELTRHRARRAEGVRKSAMWRADRIESCTPMRTPKY